MVVTGARAASQVRSVCVVDDDDAYRELLALALGEHCGVQTLAVFGRGEDAIHYICAQPEDRRPQLLVLDYHMPRMDGCAVMRALRAAGLHVPVAVLSNGASPEEQDECLREGALAFVHKPGRFEALVEALVALTHLVAQDDRQPRHGPPA